jgi:RNA polymerase-binding transcription factor DksA
MDATVESYLPHLRRILMKEARDRIACLCAGSDEQASRGEAPGVAHALDELWLCEAALRRIDIGAYGVCRDCLRDIALTALLIRPQEERCDGCGSRQSKIEEGRRWT